MLLLLMLMILLLLIFSLSCKIFQMALSTAGFETPPFICRFVDRIFLSAYFHQKNFFFRVFSIFGPYIHFFLKPKNYFFLNWLIFGPYTQFFPNFCPKTLFCQTPVQSDSPVQVSRTRS